MQNLKQDNSYNPFRTAQREFNRIIMDDAQGQAIAFLAE